MSTLCWLKQKDILLSKLSTEKNQHSVKIDKFIHHFYTWSITGEYYFFIINSFFSELPYSDIDIALIPKQPIDSSKYERLNSFFKEIEIMNKKISEYKTFDVQVWDIPVDLFLKNYDFNKEMIFGEHVFDKYSGENVSTLPGVTKIDEYLFKRRSQFFTQKHLDRQKQKTTYPLPVSLFEYDNIDFMKYIGFLSKERLFNRIILTKNFPESCELCNRIHNSYQNEIQTLIKTGCAICKIKNTKAKYLKFFLKLLEDEENKYFNERC